MADRDDTIDKRAGEDSTSSALFTCAQERGVRIALHIGEPWPSEVEEDQVIAATFGSVHRRYEFLTGRRVLRDAASHLLDCAPERIVAERKNDGRTAIGGVFSSLTHTREAFGAAAANLPVGIDVERPRVIPDAVWRRIGGANEPLGGNRLIEWTATEAVLKSLGVGLAGGGHYVTFALQTKRADHQLAWTARYLGHRFDGWTHCDGDLVWSLALAHTAAGTERAPEE